MNLKLYNKYLIIMLIFLILISAIIPNYINAYNIGDDLKLQGYGTVPYHLRNAENDGYYVSTHLVGYYDNRNVLSCILPKQRPLWSRQFK